MARFNADKSARSTRTNSRERILARQQWLAANEGIFLEPASPASIAGLFKCAAYGGRGSGSFVAIPEESRIVCTDTGHGLKDADVARDNNSRTNTAKADKREILGVLSG